MNTKHLRMIRVCLLTGVLFLMFAACVPATPTPASVTTVAPPPEQSIITSTPTVLPTPQVNITLVPKCQQLGSISGTVQGVNATDYRIAMYIFVSGWYNKPFLASPLTDISPNGTWETSVTISRNDITAAKYAALLVPKGYNPPLLSGDIYLPQELYDNSIAIDIERDDCARVISFSGYDWFVKTSTEPASPGDNYFTDNADDVFVDDEGFLHLKIVDHDGKWWCSEVINESILGYGRYIFKLVTPLNVMDPSAVLSLFTWDETSGDFSNREINIELSTWNISGNQNSQYVIQEYYIKGNVFRFGAVYAPGVTTHGFTWDPASIFFQSLAGDVTFPGETGVINSWNYTGGSIPTHGNENVRINLWLYRGHAPTHPVEIVIKSFQFIPIP